jgi:5'-phosphate synthase pdxT subunit
MKRVGVLALQGDFAKHRAVMESLGAIAVEVRKPEDLALCDALILPGGESTSILKQMRFIGLDEAIVNFAKTKPLFGTCAGLILISSQIVGDAMIPLGILDVSVERNAFGRQNDSFKAPIFVDLGPSEKSNCEAMFIRAPRIRTVGKDVKVLASYEGEPILVRQGPHLGATFHPELTDCLAIHQYFLRLLSLCH